MESPHRDGQVSADPAPSSAALVTRARRVPNLSVRSFLTRESVPRVHWTAPDGPTVVGSGAAARITADGPERFVAVRQAARDLFADVEFGGPTVARPRLFGGFAFHDRHEATATWDGFPGAQFVLPEVQVAVADGETWVTVSAYGSDATAEAVETRLAATCDRLAELPDPGPVTGPPGIEATRRGTSKEAWRRQVTDATRRIEGGDLRKVVLAQTLEADLRRPLSKPDALDRLGETYPDCYRFLVEPTEAAGFFGATPERLVSLHGHTVETGALAGSVGRGETDDEDEALASELVESEKIRHEHQLVVDAICDQFAPFGDVSVGDRTIRKLATVQHLWTPITGHLDRDEHVLSVVEALHPTPAVGGLPPDDAWLTIRETESFDRGWYAAPVGWFDAAGNGEFAVAIRSAVAAEDRATLFAGNGIVGDSDPDEEWAEVQLKFQSILDELR